MDTALTQKFPFILDRNLAKANCTGSRVCTSCDTVDTLNLYARQNWAWASGELVAHHFLASRWWKKKQGRLEKFIWVKTHVQLTSVNAISKRLKLLKIIHTNYLKLYNIH